MLRIEPPFFALLHHLGGGLRAEEGALEVGVEDAVPQRLIDVEGRAGLFDAGIIDEDVEPAQRLGRGSYTLAAGADVGNIHRDGNAAGNLREGFVETGLGSRADRHTGAGLRQADGDGLADAATGAGHQGSLAVEAETGQH